jgi:hypothetical protein
MSKGVGDLRTSSRCRSSWATRSLRSWLTMVPISGNFLCAKKARDFIQGRHFDPENRLLVRERIGEVRDSAPKVYEAISTLDEKCAEIFRGHPSKRGKP